jgi:hypothetical protein
MTARPTLALDSAVARGASPEVARDVYALEVALTPIRAQLRRLGLSGEFAEDVLPRLGAMPEGEALAAWRAFGGGA